MMIGKEWQAGGPSGSIAAAGAACQPTAIGGVNRGLGRVCIFDITLTKL
jgi:hypothetical protein